MSRLAPSFVLAAVLALSQGSAEDQPAGAQDAATREMVLRLAELSVVREENAELVSTPAFAVNQPQLIPQLRARLANAPADAQARQMQLRVELASQLLMAGDSEEALTEAAALTELIAAFEQLPASERRRALFDLEGLVAMAALRIGEQENCIARHGRHSCLFPIERDGLHEIRRGSERAIVALRRQLAIEPTDLTARWLLNLAQMTLAAYPDGVEEELLLPPELFASEGPVERFVDIAPALGVAAIGVAGGSVLEDFNGDGLLDLAVSSWGIRDQLQLFENTGTGFVERTREAGLLGLVGGINLTHADYDNDGDADLYVLRGGWLADLGEHPSSLLRNNGDGTFSDVTRAAGLLAFEPTHSAAWGDFNNDGWLDLFVACEERPRGKRFPSRLYVSNRDGTFSQYAEFAGMGVVKAVAWGDFNNDGWLDLYLSRFGRDNALYRSDPVLDGQGRPAPGLRRFTDVAAAAGVTEPRLSFPTWFFDYDNDGWLDLYLSRFGRDNALYRSDPVLDGQGRPAPGLRRFTDVAAEAGVTGPRLSFPTWFFDYDNDGWLDLFVAAWDGAEIGEVAAQYLGLPHEVEVPRLYRNNGDGTFADVTREARLDRVALAMGANYGDFDYDGWLDVYIGTGAPDLRSLMPNRMFRNAAGRRFEDVTTDGGFGHLQKGHGISFGDVDNDGDQDVHAVMGGWFSGDVYQNVLFDNPGRGDRRAALIRLHGVTSNRPGLGARLQLTVGDGETTRTIHRVVSTGGSFGSSPQRQEVGLGAAERIARLRVIWPASGTAQTFTDLPAGKLLVVREDRSEVEIRELPRADFAAARAPHSSSATH